MIDLEIRRIVYGLLQAGLVEIVRPAGAPLPVPTRRQHARRPARPEQPRRAEIRSPVQPVVQSASGQHPLDID